MLLLRSTKLNWQRSGHFGPCDRWQCLREICHNNERPEALVTSSMQQGLYNTTLNMSLFLIYGRNRGYFSYRISIFYIVILTNGRFFCVRAEHSIYLTALILVHSLSPSLFLNGALLTFANWAKASLSSLKSILVPAGKIRENGDYVSKRIS